MRIFEIADHVFGWAMIHHVTGRILVPVQFDFLPPGLGGGTHGLATGQHDRLDFAARDLLGIVVDHLLRHIAADGGVHDAGRVDAEALGERTRNFGAAAERRLEHADIGEQLHEDNGVELARQRLGLTRIGQGSARSRCSQVSRRRRDGEIDALRAVLAYADDDGGGIGNGIQEIS